MELKFPKRLFLLSAFILFLLAGCGTTDNTDDADYNFPDFVVNATYPGVKDAYMYAVDEEDGVLEYVPCYCNCGIEPFNHMSVKDCFISNTESTEAMLVYDNHGAG